LLVDTIMDMGCEVMEAEDGGEGLQMALSGAPDIILLDFMMPVMDGLQVLGNLKNDPKTKAIPVIMVSAKGRDEDVAKALDAGATSYVTKPWRHGELESVIASAGAEIQRGRTPAL
jgi:CheY-like chemotaxis protein